MDKISFLVVWQYHHKKLTKKKKRLHHGIPKLPCQKILNAKDLYKFFFFWKKKRLKNIQHLVITFATLSAKDLLHQHCQTRLSAPPEIFFSSWTPGSNSSSFPTFNRTPRAELLHEKLINGINRAALPSPSCANSLGMMRFDDLFNMTHVRPPRLFLFTLRSSILKVSRKNKKLFPLHMKKRAAQQSTSE